MIIEEDEYKAVSLLIELSTEMNKSLTNASERCLRSKSKEATIRLVDSLENFLSIETPGDFNNTKTIAVVVFLSSEMNRKLSISATEMGRSKTKEAQIRLRYHLQNFSNIACLGQRFDFC
jgi:hypothetical protein